ncbi:MAG: 3-phosphoshikimate 1-carboxyvinyltransferase [Candidatus Gastranaerophilaceae bacterium]|nr:3-phosphoshikimate 1-carboxyvinyltransferase [Candidatus Gastranaerophilaceae bacterium]
MIKNVKKLVHGLKGNIEIPSDKSISHRAIMFSSIAKGTSRIINFSNGEDPKSTLKIFRQLGVDIAYKDEKTVIVNSDGKLRQPLADLDCENSGTTMRLASGILAGQNFNTRLTGDISLSKRPMKRIITPLSLMGAKIESEDNHAPLNIYGNRLTGIDYNSQIASAQVKSSVLLAGLYADGTTKFTEPYISRNHTEILLKYLGADITTKNTTTIINPSELTAKDIIICGDISSAAYFMAAALIVPNSDIILKNVGLNPTRTGIIKVIEKMGGYIEILNKEKISGEEVGDIRIKTSDLKGITIGGELIPQLIDEIPIIAVIATQAKGETVIKDAQDLRNKESDRIKSTVCELKKLGANIEETEDGFIINGKTNLKGETELNTYHDHRLAMSLYVAGLICDKEIAINDFEWVNISFPEFAQLFQTLQN